MTGFNSKREAAVDKLQEPVNLLEARRIAAEYGTPGSQVDDGNLYFALSKCLEHIDALPAQEPVAWADLQKKAQQIVESKFLWKRFIDGTPLANDIACWMADFALQYTPPPQPAQEPDAYQSGFYDGKKSARARCIELVLSGTGEPVQTRTLEILQEERKRIAKLIEEDGKP